MTPLRRVGSCLLATSLLVFIVAPPAVAAPEPDPSVRNTMRICDPTGCYVAWYVVDSDNDGVNDADEVMAGTDPHDPTSRPGLTPLLELGLARQLPSFEAGLGAFIAFPAEILTAIAAGGPDPLGAFPMNGRKDALTKAGIDLGKLGEAGIDLSRDGLSLGLGGISVPGSHTPMRVGGINASLVSNLDTYTSPAFGAEHGGLKSIKPTNGGKGTISTFNDGSVKNITATDGAGIGDFSTSWTNPDGSPGQSSVTEHGPRSYEGANSEVAVDPSRETTWNPDGSVASVAYKEVREGTDGTTTVTDTVLFERDEDGKVVGQTKIHVVETEYNDGYASTGVEVEKCDAGGENCSTVYANYGSTTTSAEDDEDADNEEYVNPDADTTIVTYEVVEQKLKVRGAAIKVVEGWAAPGFENDPTNPRDPTTIAYIDGELGQSYLLLNPLRITKAQPEGVRDDLSNPLVPGGGCWPKCP